MEKYRDLYIKVDPSNTAGLIASIDAALNSGWERDSGREEAEAREAINERELFYYVCDKRGAREAALVVICRHNPETLHVSTVVPREMDELKYEQYNAILTDFNDNVLSRISASFPIAFLLASDELHIEDLMPKEAFEALRRFSLLANKASGSSHPMDRERWIVFLVTLHRSTHRLDSESLKRWLVEVEGWSDEWAHKLVCEFELAISVLKYADATRPR
jgi:hypothetical protein